MQDPPAIAVVIAGMVASSTARSFDFEPTVTDRTNSHQLKQTVWTSLLLL